MVDIKNFHVGFGGGACEAGGGGCGRGYHAATPAKGELLFALIQLPISLLLFPPHNDRELQDRFPEIPDKILS